MSDIPDIPEQYKESLDSLIQTIIHYSEKLMVIVEELGNEDESFITFSREGVKVKITKEKK